MATMEQATGTLQISIAGLDPSQRIQHTLAEGETAAFGRQVQSGWTIPWDRGISRDHGKLTWRGGNIHVVCNENAVNSIIYRGQPTRDSSVLPGEWFQIGQTAFHFELVKPLDSRPHSSEQSDVEIEYDREPGEVMGERAYTSNELQKVAFRDTDKQMELLSSLPDKISASHSDEELGELLARLLLDVIPQAEAAAVAHYDQTELPDDESSIDDFPNPLTMRVATREDFSGRFSPSRRMILKALSTQNSVIHVWAGEDTSQQFTVSEGLGWAFCAPICGESCQGWCLYLSGKGIEGGGLVVSEEELAPDLRFTELVGRFIGSIRQVRMLQEQKTQLSSFFSPKVIENLTESTTMDVLQPSEKDISVLFCDVRGFSKKSESLQDDLHQLLRSVSAALGVMAESILERDGAIADFQGDAALGFWGWPKELEQGSVPACRAALSIYREFTQAIKEADGLLTGFSVGIGVAHGRALAGQVGTSQQAKIGVFGPVVNQGSRLEGMTKQFSVPICIDEQTAEYVQRYLPPTEGRLRRLARVRPKGMDTPLTVYGLIPPESEFPDISTEDLERHEEAVDAVIEGNWTEALDLLLKLPDDGPKRFLTEHMQEFDNQPPDGWDGVFSLVKK